MEAMVQFEAKQQFANFCLESQSDMHDPMTVKFESNRGASIEVM